MDHESALSAKDLLIGYNGIPLFSCEELLVNRGELGAIMGCSGSGKSTLFSALTGEIPLISGSIYVSGEKINSESRREKVVRTVQSFPLFHWLDVRGNIELAATVRGAKLTSNVESYLAEAGADHLVDRWPKELSGGERCRVSLAIALMSNPDVLLLDEPFNGLDLLMREDAAEAVRLFIEKTNCAALMITHDYQDVEKYCSSIAFLSPGTPGKLSNLHPVDPHYLQRKLREILLSGRAKNLKAKGIKP